MANITSANLAKLLALTGRIPELDSLEKEALQLNPRAVSGPIWGWPKEFRAWVRKRPEESYKCGLYCLDQLGRLTQSGQFKPKDITETASSTNGFTVAELLNIGSRAGLKLHAALISDFTQLPVPCI